MSFSLTTTTSTTTAAAAPLTLFLPSLVLPPSSVPSTSYYGISIKSLRLMGEPGLYGKRLWEKRDDGGVCAP